MKIRLLATDAALCTAWEKEFKDVQNVSIEHTGVFDNPNNSADAIVSPANSFGFMDGGIDYIYSEHFGWDLQKRLQEQIRYQYHGELPVGCALIVPTGNDNIPWLISAPTMRVPLWVTDTPNAYLAFRAALLAAVSKGFQSIICPGLGTGAGCMPYEKCARQMRQAYNDVDRRNPFPATLKDAIAAHSWLTVY